MNIFLQKYNLTLIDGSRITAKNMPGLKILKQFDWKVIQNPANDSIKKELYQNIRFVPSIVYPALNFINGIRNHQKKGTINVIHLRIEQDWLDHVSLYQTPYISPDDAYNEIANKYIIFIQKYIHQHEITFILTGSISNKVIDYLRNNRYNYFLFPKITPYREKNAAMDMVIGAQCNHVFIGCGGSSFSDILIHRIDGENIQKYLC